MHKRVDGGHTGGAESLTKAGVKQDTLFTD
jgi:hypothetical protein